MKKAVSLVLLTVFVSSLAGPAAAQRRVQDFRKQPVTKNDSPSKIDSPAKPQLVKAGPTKTEFGRVGAYSDGSGVYVAWEMVAEVRNIGFNVYRLGKDGAELLNPSKFIVADAVHARQAPVSGRSFGYFDRSGTGSDIYYVEALGIDGRRTVTPNLTPHYVSEL